MKSINKKKVISNALIKYNITPFEIFLMLSVIGLVIRFIMMLITEGQFMSELIWDGRNPVGSDYWVSVEYVRGGADPYRNPADEMSYAPLSQLMFYIISVLTPKSIADSKIEGWYGLIFCGLICVCVCICYMVFSEMIKTRSKWLILLFACVFFLSQPILYATIKSGNSVLYVMTMLLLAFFLRDGEKPIEKEIALLLIAASAGQKIVPAVLGLLYIKEKRYKEAMRLVLYGVLFFFIPFFAFGGIYEIKEYIDVLNVVALDYNPRPETIFGVAVEICTVVGVSESLGMIIAKALTCAYLVVCIAVFMLSKVDWKSMTILSSLMVVLVNKSGPYTLCYFVIPLVILFQESQSANVISNTTADSTIDYIGAILFSLIFTGYPFLEIDVPIASFITNYFWVYILLIGLIVVFCWESYINKNVLCLEGD